MDINEGFEWSHESDAGEFNYPLADRAALRAHYLDQGYVVVRGAVPGLSHDAPPGRPRRR